MAETKSKSTRTTKSSAAGKPSAEKATSIKRPPAATAKPKSATPVAKAEKPKAAAKLRTTPQSAKTATAKKKGNGDMSITPEQRYRMISDAAYYRAQRRGFVGGNPSEDWYAAESEVDELIHSMRH